MTTARQIEPDLDFIREVKKAGGDQLKKCFQCATCSVVCNLSPENNPFPRKEMIQVQWGLSDILAQDPDIWMCYQCNDCTINCPRGARPGDVLAAVRYFIYKKFSFPSFMGKALASSKALPLLLLVPVLLLFGCIFAFAPTSPDGEFLFLQTDEIDFNLFLPHSAIDVLFVFGNIMIFIFAAIGLTRFWKNLQNRNEEKKIPFTKALLLTLKEIINHSSFFKCEINKSRSWGHILLIGGFFGAMIATGLVFVLVFIPHYLEIIGLIHLSPVFELPIEFPNLIKIFGVLGGLGLVIGGIMLITRRWKNRDDVGANSYSDYLFLYIIFLTGLTGMLTWITRLVGIPMLAYVTYFIHMIFVFFLLWYMPYSKFAHMIYRMLGLVYCRMIGREARA